MPGKSLVKYKPQRRLQCRTVKLEVRTAAPPPSVVKVARVFDEATGTAFDRFAAKSDLGEDVMADVAREESERPAKVLSELRKHNAALTTKASLDDVQAAIDAPPQRHVRHAAQPGWYRGEQKAFVRPTHVVGSVPGVEELLPPRARQGDKRQIVFGNSGTVEGWREGVAHHARWSTRATLMIGTAFAGPLLRVLGYQSFGILQSGPRKAGKSTAQLAGGSIVGLRNEEALPSCEATVAGMYLIAGQSNDGLLPVNEVGLLGRNAYRRLSPLIYGLSEGKDRVRHTESAYASDAGASGWRVVYTLSSEHSAEALAAQCGMARQGGEIARCFDVPAVHSGNATIFDRRPKGMTDEAFTRVAHWRMAEMRRACEENHGVVFDAYLRGLIALGDALKPRIQAYVDEFVGSLFLKDADGAVNHAARNFGVIYAGLRLAMEFGLLGPRWRPLTTRQSIKRCFRDGLKISRLQDTTLADAKAVLHQKLKETELPDRRDARRGVHVGSRMSDGPDTLIAIRSTEFARWFASKAQLHAILMWLDQTGALRRADEAKRPSGKGYEWAVTTPRWTPEGKDKCIVFRLPANEEGRIPLREAEA